MKYEIELDFDCYGDPPRIYISEADGGPNVLEVIDNPVCTHPSGWSWDEDDWEPSALSVRILTLLNEDRSP